MNKFLLSISDDLAESYYEETSDNYESTLKKLGSQISSIRKAMGISQKQLSQRTRISQANISKIENGKYNISILSLEKILKILGAQIVLEVNNDK